MNKKFKKFLKRTGIVTTGIVAFGGTLVGGYLLAPNRTSLIDVSVKQKELTPFERFVEKISKDVGMVEDEENPAKNYLSARFDDLLVEYTVEDSNKVNTITVDGGLDVRVSDLSLSGIEFNIDATANYNNKDLHITLGHFQNDIYFGLKDMKIKFSEFDEAKLLDTYAYSFALYAGFDFPQIMADLGTLVGDKLGGLLDGLMNGTSSSEVNSASSGESSGINFSALLSEGPKTAHNEEVKEWTFTLGEEGSDLCITIITSEDYTLKRVELGTISAGSVTISGSIDFELKNYEDFVSPASGNDYIEVFNYNGLTQKLISLLKEDGKHQKLGLEFSLDLDSNKNQNEPVDIVKVDGSVNVDFDNLLDLSQYHITASEDDFKRSISDSSVYNTIKKAGFNLQLDLLGKNDKNYANLELVFAEGQGYLKFNEQEDEQGNKDAVMKLNVDVETMNWILDKVPELIEKISDKETNTLDTLSKFLSEDLVNSIKDGDFSFILDMINKLSNDENGFELGIDMSNLGIGDEAYLDLKIKNDTNVKPIEEILEDIENSDEYKELQAIIDSNASEEEKEAANNAIRELLNSTLAEIEANNNSGLELAVSDLAFGDFSLNVAANTAKYKPSSIELDENEKNSYQSVKFVKDVVDQVSEFVNTKKTGFSVTGSMKDANGLGTDFTGRGQLDNNTEVKNGFGTMQIKEYKYNKNKVWATHDLAVDVTNLESNVYKTYDSEGNVLTRNNQNEALFVYGDPNGSCVKGKMHLQTFADIYELFTTFIDDYSDDPKYTKFLAPITNLLGMSSLGDIIESKDYMRLASNELLKKFEVINNGGGLRIVVSKALLGLPNDITIEVEFNGNNETGNQTLKALHVRDFALSGKEDAKVLNFTFQLEDYDPNMNNVIHRNENYMNLDGVKTLLELGINTTKVNYYHLTAAAHVETVLGIDIELSGINFYVYVDGVTAKVYGSIAKIPTIVFVTQDVNDELFTGEKDMSCEFAFETYEENQDNKVGGVFNIRRTLKDQKSRVVTTSSFPFIKTVKYYDCKSYHYRTDSGYFMDNITDYLLRGVLGLNSSAMSTIMGSSSSSLSDEKPAGDFTKTFTSTGFNCSTTGTGLSTVHTIKLGLNLNQLTGIDALNELEATIKSRRITYAGNTEGMDILSSLNATLRVHFAVDINVSFNAAVAEAQVLHADALARWNATAANKLANLSGKVNGVTIGENSSYYNNATNPYTYSYEETIG